MNLESTTNSASASGPEFESQSYKIRVRDVSLIPNGQTSVRGFSLATLAAALAACGGGGSGGPAAPPPPPPPPPPNNAPTASPDAGAATEDGGAVTGGTGGADSDGDSLTYSVTSDPTYGSLSVAADGTWTYEVDNSNDMVQGLADGAELSDTATITVSDGEDSVEATVSITITGANDAPTGEDGAGAATAGMDVAAEGNVNAADVDEGDTHTFSVTEGKYGTFTVDEAGAWSYSLDHANEAVVALAEGATAEDTATITIDDGNGGTTTATVTITVTGVNDDPTAEDGTGAVMAKDDTPAMGDVNAADVDTGDTHTYAVGTATAHGTLEVDAAGAWTYTLDQYNADVRALDDNETLEDSGTIVVTDNNGGSATVNVTITVTGVNDAPGAPEVAVMNGSSVSENDGSGVNLASLEAADPEGHDVTFAVDDDRFEIELVGNAALLKVKDGVELDREATQDGTITLMVTATDSKGATSAPTEVVVTVTNVNEAPTGEDTSGAVTARADDAATGDVNGSDVDWGDTLSFAVGTAASNGTLDVDDATGAWTYTLDDANEAVMALAEGAMMEDTGTIMITDAGGLSAEVSVTITITGVNEDPTGDDGSGDVTAAMGDTASGDVNAADVDVGDTHEFAVGTAASHGTLEVDATGAWTYMLDDTNAAVIALAEGATMEDTATIMIMDNNGGSAEVSVTITVTGVNEAPTADDTSGVVMIGGVAATGDVNAADVDVGDTHEFAVGTAPAYGTLEVDATGNWTYTLDETHEAVVALAEDATMEDGGTIVMMDDKGGSVEVNVAITVVGSNDAPTITVMDGQTPEGMPAVSTIYENAPGLPVGSVVVSDPDQALDASHVSTSDERFVIKTDALGGLWLALADGVSLDHETDPTVDVTVTVTDDRGASAEQTVTVTVDNVDEAPYAPTVTPAASNLTIQENDVSGMNLAELSSHDPEEDAITFHVDNDDFEIEVVGSAALLKVKDGVALDYEATEDGTITLMVTASDHPGSNISDPTEVVVTVTDVNEAPTSEDGEGAVTAGAEMPATGDVNGQDVDAGDMLSYAVETDAMFGTVMVDDAGAWTYTLDEENAEVVAMPVGATMEDTATIMVTDAAGLTSMSTVTITITGTNEAPTGDDSPGGVTAGAGMPTSGNVNGSDVDTGDMLTYSVSVEASYGVLAVDEEGVWTYTLDEANAEVLALPESGSMEDSGTIMIDDGNGGMTPVSVTIFISGNNEAPTISVMDDLTPDMMEAYDVIEENATGPVGRITVHDEEDGISGPVTPSRDANGRFVFTDADGDALTLTVSDSRFIVKEDPAGGLWLVLNEAVDHEMEESVDVTVTVIDSNHARADATVTITISNVDEAPTIEVVNSVTPDGMPAVNARDENSPGPVGMINISDPEDDLTEANLMVVDDTRFSVETDDYGDIWLKLDEGVNFEEVGESIDVTVRVTDSGGHTVDAVVSVRINDVNEAPSVSFDGSEGTETPNGTPAESTIEENSTGPVGLITPMDQEDGLSGPVTVARDSDGGYVVTDGDGDSLTFTVGDARFSVKEDMLGGLWLFLNEGIDADTEAEVTVALTVTDAGGLDAGIDAVITIANINEPPTITVQPGVVPAADGGAGASGTLDENAMGPAYEIIVSDQEGDLTAEDVSINDGRFEVKTDSEGGLWVFLKDPGVNYEGEDRMSGTADDISSIDIVVTVIDADRSTEEASATVTIRDVNDAPHALQDGVSIITAEATDEAPQMTEPLKDLVATAGGQLVNMKVDLGGMFGDEDGDSNFRYTLEDAPPWLELINVVYGDDGSVTGTLIGTVPAGVDQVSNDVKVAATDEGGATGYATFNVIVDDGNDAPTAIHLINTDGTDNDFFDLDVDEGSQGTVLGHLRVDDQDDARHPHGQHTWKVDDDNVANFEIVEMDGNQVLKLKDDADIDFEDSATISVTVTATDGATPMGAAIEQRIDIEVNDMNDPVELANQPGNWWVTINDDTHDPEDVAEGAYLTFALEIDGTDTLPVFTDEDESGDNSMLTYALSGADWLEIDPMTGVITNKAGEEDAELPERGVYDITVTATDGAESTQQATFKLAVAVSGDDNEDNDDPDIGSRREINVVENSPADTVVATFTVTDEDLDLTDGDTALHPWADVDVVIESIQGTPTDGGAAVDLDDGVLELKEVSRDDESITYNVVVTTAGVMQLNYETYDEITFNVRAYDGIADETALTDENSDLVGFDFEITDVNEAPAVMRESGTHSSANLGESNTPAVAVEQSEEETITLYINLSNYFEDPDEDDDDDELTYSVSEDTPWITITAQAGEWRDVQEGPDGDDGTDDDVVWDTGLDDPGDRDYVAVLEIDRTGMTNAQDANGSFTITVTDSSGQKVDQVVMVTITDENLAPAEDAEGVEISDDTPHQNERLTMRFDDSVDPDFTGAEAGEPILEVFQWHRDNAEADDGDGELQAVSVDNPTDYMVTQADVGMVVQGSVVYFELFGEMIVKTEAGANDAESALEARSEAVADRADPATGTITFSSTNGEQELVATLSIMDPDGMDPTATDTQATAPVYTWESSANGRGGWTAFDDNDATDGDANMQTTTTANVPEGHSFVRLVVTFNDHNGTPERIVSDAIEVGTIATLDPLPTITGFGTEMEPAVGRTLEVMADANDEVEWLAGGMVIGTGSEFTLTSAHAALMISARITTNDADGKVTSIVTTEEVTVAGTPPVNTSAIALDADVVLLGKAPAMDGMLMRYDTTIDAESLFEDIEGGLTFSFASTDAGADDYGDQTLDVSLSNDGTQLLVIDETTGEVRYYTTKANNHGDSSGDGAGNMVTITVAAMDGTNDEVPNMVHLAIDVPGAAPTGLALTYTVDEFTAMTAAETTAADVGGVIDIVDNNAPTNVYGQYEWTISDDRFTVTAVETDTSQAQVRVKADQKFEIEDDDGDDGTLMVTITATPQGEFSDTPITMTLTVTITNNDDDDPPAAGEPNEVPGLKDNETGSDDNMDDEEEDGDDDDDDGGTPPPEMDAMAAMASMLDDGLF